VTLTYYSRLAWRRVAQSIRFEWTEIQRDTSERFVKSVSKEKCYFLAVSYCVNTTERIAGWERELLTTTINCHGTGRYQHRLTDYRQWTALVDAGQVWAGRAACKSWPVPLLYPHQYKQYTTRAKHLAMSTAANRSTTQFCCQRRHIGWTDSGLAALFFTLLVCVKSLPSRLFS